MSDDFLNLSNLSSLNMQQLLSCGCFHKSISQTPNSPVLTSRYTLQDKTHFKYFTWQEIMSILSTDISMYKAVSLKKKLNH